MGIPTVAKPRDRGKRESWPDPTAPARRCGWLVLLCSTVQLLATLVAWWV